MENKHIVKLELIFSDAIPLLHKVPQRYFYLIHSSGFHSSVFILNVTVVLQRKLMLMHASFFRLNLATLQKARKEKNHPINTCSQIFSVKAISVTQDTRTPAQPDLCSTITVLPSLSYRFYHPLLVCILCLQWPEQIPFLLCYIKICIRFISIVLQICHWHVALKWVWVRVWVQEWYCQTRGHEF